MEFIKRTRQYYNPNTGRKQGWYALFRCACGKEKECFESGGRSKHTKSCGCVISNKGLSKTPEYKTWSRMKDRCLNNKCPDYSRYGGRGISICDTWLVFKNFYQDLGARPKNHSLDRIDNNGNYEPGNCRWATSLQQARNRRSNRDITFQGTTKCFEGWCKELNISSPTVRARIKRGWPIHETFFKPTRKWNCKT